MGLLGTNQSEKRQRAYEALQRAKRAGVTGRDLATLQAAYDAAVAEHESAKRR